MLTIKHHGNKFRVRASAPGAGGRGFYADARNLAEIVEVINHYYGTQHATHPRPGTCPFCKETSR